MNSQLEGLASGRCPHGLYVGLSNFRCKDCEIAALAARLAEAERLLREWVADAYWDLRANLPDLVNRTRHAIGAARATDSADVLRTPDDPLSPHYDPTHTATADEVKP